MNLPQHYLAPIELQTLLTIGPHPWRDLDTYCSERGIAHRFCPLTTPLPDDQRFDLSVVYGFEAVSKRTINLVFGQLKNSISERIWALTPRESQ